MSINGEACGRGDVGLYMRMVSSVGSSIGQDHGSAVSDRYSAPFAFSGTLHSVDIVLPKRPSADDVAATAAAEMSRQ